MNKNHVFEIKPPNGLINFNFQEFWRFRELFFIFVWRDIKVRYKQTVLGITWAIFQPFVTMVIFSVFFGRLVGVPSGDIPYPILVFSGLLLWNYFSLALTNASESLVASESIIKKIYFPRLILPLATTITPAIDFGFALIVLAGLMVFYRFVPGFWGLVFLPLALILAMLTAVGLGLLLSAINAKYRDVRYVLPFFIQILLFLTPVIYPVNIIPIQFQWLLYLNPMTGIITLTRYLLLGSGNLNWTWLAISLASGLIIFIIGLNYFRKTERYFADVI